MDRPVCRRAAARRCLTHALLWSAIAVLGASVAGAGEKEDAEAAKWERIQREGRGHHRGPMVVDPESEARDALERDAATTPGAAPAGTTDGERKAAAPRRAAPAQSAATEGFDWEGLLSGGGPVSDGLQLGLGTSGAPFRFGDTYPLFVALTNHGAARRLEEMPACDSLGRTETLVFRVRTAQGDEFEVPNRFRDSTALHPHPPLEIGSGASVTGVVDFAGLGLGSAIPFAALRSGTLTLRAEVPPLGLASNEVEVRIDIESIPQ